MKPYPFVTMLAELLGRDDTGTTDGHVDRSVQKWNEATQILCITTMTIFFALRCFTRLVIMDGFRREDCKGLMISSRWPVLTDSQGHV